jgi:hypothetical protein
MYLACLYRGVIVVWYHTLGLAFQMDEWDATKLPSAGASGIWQKLAGVT